MNIAPSLPRNSDIAMLEDSLERYLRDSYSFEHRRTVLKKPDGFDRGHWRFLSESGFLGLPFSEQDGGFGGSLVDVMSVMRHLGRALVLEPYLSCVVFAGRLLAHSTIEEIKAPWLAGLIGGQCLLGLAHLERGDRARGQVRRTVLVSESGRLRLDGAKVLVPVAKSLDALLVTARNAQGQLRVVLVPASAPGVVIRQYRAADGHVVGDVTFDGVVLDASAQLDYGDVEAALDDTLTYADAAMCAEAVGCMQSLFDMTAEYLRTRKQFGQPIGAFQVLKHRIVDCYASVEQAMGLLELAAATESPHWKANVAAARAFIGEQARHVGHEAIQMHGGMGLSDELAVSHFHKRISVLGLMFGDRTDHTDRFLEARDLVGGEPTDTTLPLAQLLAVEEREFQSEVREFLHQKLSEEIRIAVRRQTSTYPEAHAVEAWRQRLHEQGLARAALAA